MPHSVLSLLPLHRPHRDLGGGAFVSERHSKDFVIDGSRLSQLLGGDLASCLGWGDPASDRAAVDRLLRRTPPDYPPDRVALYICPECGGLDCGAVSASIAIDGSTVTWKDFGWQRDPEDSAPPRLDYPSLGPFVFSLDAYQRVLRDAHTSGAWDAV